MSFFKAVATVGGFTMVSRVLGFVRDVLIANFLGAGPVADAFFIALKLPNFFRRITAEGSFSVAFVPMFSKLLSDEGKKEALSFAEEAQAVMLAVLIPFTILGMIAMPWVLYVLAPGVHGDPQRYELALEFSRITFPYILMMSLTSLLGGVLNSFDRFGPFAAAPIFFNGMMMCSLLFGKDWFETGGHALAWGLAAAGIVQFIWVLINYVQIGHFLRPRLPRLTPRVRKLFRLMLPGAIGSGAAQINLFIDMILASLLPVGSISFLYYADRLYQLPLGVIGAAIGTALLPMLSRALKSEQKGESTRLFGLGFETGLILSLPAAIALIVIAGPIMSVLFERGEFDHASSLQSAHALMAYSMGLPAYVIARVFSTAFFAREDTVTPVKFAIVCAAINTGLALAMIHPLHHVGIALATGITAWVNVGLLLHGLHKKRHLDLPANSLKRACLILLSGLIMAAVLWGMTQYAVGGMLAGGTMARVAGLGSLVTAGGLVYFAGLHFFGIFTLNTLKALFPKRGKKDKIVDVVQRIERES